MSVRPLLDHPTDRASWNNEEGDLTRVEFNRRNSPDPTMAVFDCDGVPVSIPLYPEDRRAFERGGYTISSEGKFSPRNPTVRLEFIRDDLRIRQIQHADMVSWLDIRRAGEARAEVVHVSAEANSTEKVIHFEQPAPVVEKTKEQPCKQTGLDHDDVKLLTDFFEAEEHNFNRGWAYIEEWAVCERLEQVDPAWSFEILDVTRQDPIAEGGKPVVTVKARLTIKGVSRDNVGMSDVQTLNNKTNKETGEIEQRDHIEANEAEKSATTDALKRCARLFGVGRYLLRLPKDNNRNPLVKTEAALASWIEQQQRLTENAAKRLVAHWRKEGLSDSNMLEALHVQRFGEYVGNYDDAMRAINGWLAHRIDTKNITPGGA